MNKNTRSQLKRGASSQIADNLQRSLPLSFWDKSKRVLWETLILLINIYHLITIPFRCCFLQDFGYKNEYLPLILMDYLGLTILVIECVIRAKFSAIPEDIRRALHTGTGNPCNRKKSFAQLSREHAPEDLFFISQWFYVELFSLIPYEVFASRTSPSFRYYYLPRLIGIIRLPNLRDYIIEYLEQENILRNTGFQRMWILFAFMLINTHIGGCLFYYVSLNDAENGILDTWGMADGLWSVTMSTQNVTRVVFKRPLYERYMRSVYWACVTMVTTGFGDIVPLTVDETLVCIVAMYVGFIVTCASIANLTIVVTNLGAAETEHQRIIENFKKYTVYRNIPSTLAFRIRRFYGYVRHTLGGVSENMFLKGLPIPLRQRIVGYVTRDLLSRVSAFRSISPFTLTLFLEILEQHFYSPADRILEPNEEMLGMLFVGRGEILLLNARTGAVQQKRKKSENIGIECLFEDTKSEFAIVAKTYCELYLLPNIRFRLIAGAYCTPKDISEMKRVIESTLKSQEKLKKFAGLDEQVIVKGWRQHFLPDSTFRRRWRVVHVFFMSYYLVTFPIHLVHAAEVADFTNMGRVLITISDAFCDLFFALNLLFEANYFAFTREGVVVTNSYWIRKIFFKQSAFKIAILVLGVIPFEVLTFVFGLGVNYISSFRMGRIFRLIHITAYLEKINKVLQSSRLQISSAAQRLVGLNAVMLIFCHWVGCIWYFVGRYGRVTNEANTWLREDLTNTDYSVDHSAFGETGGYFRAVYWALVAMSTVGYGDIRPMNTYETMCSIGVILVGGLVLPAVVGGLASLMSNMNPSKAEFERKMDEIKHFLSTKYVMPLTQQKIVRYYNYLWSRQGGVQESELLQDIPQTLQLQIATAITGSAVRAIPCFAESSLNFQRALVSELVPRTFIPKDVIIRSREVGSEMYLIERGVIDILTDRNILLATLTQGDYVGEGALIGEWRRNATATARSYSDCFLLSKAAFDKAIDQFPEEGDRVFQSLRMMTILKSQQNTRIVNNFKRYTKVPSIALDEKHGILVMNLRKKRWERIGHPDSVFRMYWNILMLFTVIYNALMIPFRIAFEHNFYLYFLDWLLDISLGLDIFFNIHVFAFMFEGDIHYDAEAIAERYRSNKLFCLCDIIAAIPFDLLAVFTIGSMTFPPASFLPLLRVFRIFKAARIVTFISELNVTLDHYFSNMSRLKFMQLLMGVLLVAHWAGCLFYATTGSKTSDKCAHVSETKLTTSDSARYNITERARCLYNQTWVEYQIRERLLPENGGDVTSRYLRSINWALPTLVVVVIGDVTPVSSEETMYCLLWMLVGVTVNSVIIGNIANLVANVENDVTTQARRIDSIKTYMHHNDLPLHLQVRGLKFLEYIRDTNTSFSDESIIADLPLSLQVTITNTLRAKYVRKCPFFENAREPIVRDITHCLVPRMFGDGDLITRKGDLGQELYLIEHGSVHVEGDDGNVFAKLTKGSFFGEIALFFAQKRTATVRAADFTRLLVLHKSDFDYVLARHQSDPTLMLTTFRNLQNSNRKRNSAIAKNLASCKQEGNKLNRILVESTQIALKHSDHDNFFTTQLLGEFLHDFQFQFTWNLICLGCVLFQLFVIPLKVALIASDEMVVLTLDYVCDAILVVDAVFTFRHAQLVHQSPNATAIERKKIRYSKMDFLRDFFLCFPYDLACLWLGSQALPYLRFPRMARVIKLSTWFTTLESHLSRLHVQIRTATSRLIQFWVYVVLLNHWGACVWLTMYRLDGYQANSWAGHDPLSHADNPRSTRYIRAIYFVLTTLSSVGYGDIRPWVNRETVFELFVVLISACTGAAFIGQMSAYYEYLDSDGKNGFKKKINMLRDYMNLRGMPEEIQTLVINHHTQKWKQSHCLDDEDIAKYFPVPLQEEIALHIFRDIIEVTPLLRSMLSSFQKRVALALRVQTCPARSSVYKEGDFGQEIYFIGSGTLRRTVGDVAHVASTNIAIKKVWREYGEDADGILVSGEYFGEQTLTCLLGVRNDSVTALSYSELYILDRNELEKAMICLTGVKRIEFIRVLLRLKRHVHQRKETTRKFTLDRSVRKKSIQKLHRQTMLGKTFRQLLRGSKGQKRTVVLPTLKWEDEKDDYEEFDELDAKEHVDNKVVLDALAKLAL